MAALDVLEVDCWTFHLVHAPLDFRHLKKGVNFLGDAHEVAASLEIEETFSKASISHRLTRTGHSPPAPLLLSLLPG